MTEGATSEVRMPMTFHDVVPDRMDRLLELFGKGFSEGNVAFYKLRQVIGEDIDAGRERYGWMRVGKADASSHGADNRLCIHHHLVGVSATGTI